MIFQAVKPMRSRNEHAALKRNNAGLRYDVCWEMECARSHDKTKIDIGRRGRGDDDETGL